MAMVNQLEKIAYQVEDTACNLQVWY